MTRQQQDTIQAIFPMAAEKTFLHREFENAEVIGKDISDPIGQPVEVYRRTRDQIRAALPSLIEFIQQTEAANRKAAEPVPAPYRIAIAADHGGVEIKDALHDCLAQRRSPYSP